MHDVWSWSIRGCSKLAELKVQKNLGLNFHRDRYKVLAVFMRANAVLLGLHDPSTIVFRFSTGSFWQAAVWDALDMRWGEKKSDAQQIYDSIGFQTLLFGLGFTDDGYGGQKRRQGLLNSAFVMRAVTSPRDPTSRLRLLAEGIIGDVAVGTRESLYHSRRALVGDDQNACAACIAVVQAVIDTAEFLLSGQPVSRCPEVTLEQDGNQQYLVEEIMARSSDKQMRAVVQLPLSAARSAPPAKRAKTSPTRKLPGRTGVR